MIQVTPRDYSFIAPVYDHIFNIPLAEGHQKMGTLMKKTRSKNGASKVLEVGVGSGLTFSHVPAHVDFTGIDVNEKMLSQASKKAVMLKKRKINLEIMDAVKMRFASHTFDLVMAPSVLSAMQEPMSGLKEIIRVTKKGGKIAVIANLRQADKNDSTILKVLDPFTRKFLGFRLDLTLEEMNKFKNLRIVEKKPINNFFGQALSTYVLFEKI